MTRQFFNRAKTVLDSMIEKQTYNVDTVSGATFSSKGLISAVKNALTGTKSSGTAVTKKAFTGEKGIFEVATVSMRVRESDLEDLRECRLRCPVSRSQRSTF